MFLVSHKLSMALLARLFGDVATVTYPARMAGCTLKPETEIDGQESLCRLRKQSFGKIVEVKERAFPLVVFTLSHLMRCIRCIAFLVIKQRTLRYSRIRLLGSQRDTL